MISTGETLLSPSAIKLYGRIIPGLDINIAAAGAGLGNNKFLRLQLKSGDPRFARIYGYSYEGAYTALPRPAVFLVHGPGQSAATVAAFFNVMKPTGSGEEDPTLRVSLLDPDGKAQQVQFSIKDASVAPAPADLDKSGVAAKSWEFAADVSVWEYDRGDFSLRLDIDSGPLERILLGSDGEEEMPYFRGRKTRLRGSGD